MPNLDALREYHFANRDPAYKDDESEDSEEVNERNNQICDLYEEIDNAMQSAFNLLSEYKSRNIIKAYERLSEALQALEKER